MQENFGDNAGERGQEQQYTYGVVGNAGEQSPHDGYNAGGDDWGRPPYGSVKRTRVQSTCAAYILGCVSHNLPFFFHEKEGTYNHHIKATGIFTAGLMLLASTIAYVKNGHRPLFAGIDSAPAPAALTFLGYSVLFGIALGLGHKVVNTLCGVKDRSGYGVKKVEGIQMQPPGHVTTTSPTEATGLLGKDGKGALLARFSHFHPVRAVYPASPVKTFAWASFLSVAALALTAAFHSDLLDSLNNSDFGQVSADTTLNLALSVGVGLFAAGVHKGVARCMGDSSHRSGSSFKPKPMA